MPSRVPFWGQYVCAEGDARAVCNRIIHGTLNVLHLCISLPPSFLNLARNSTTITRNRVYNMSLKAMIFTVGKQASDIFLETNAQSPSHHHADQGTDCLLPPIETQQVVPQGFKLLPPRIPQSLFQRTRLRRMLIAFSLKDTRSPRGVRKLDLQLAALRAGVLKSNLQAG